MKLVIDIPNNPTNGDIIKTMFPNAIVKPHMFGSCTCGVDVRVFTGEHTCFELWFPTHWWDAPYKIGREE